MPPLFSIVIPAYEAADFITQALDSINRQGFRDYEVIVVDDGSSDHTLSIVAKWASVHAGPCVRLMSQNNRGIGGARNRGIKEARGEYVAFLDADDIWLEDKLEKVADYFRENGAADLLCHDEWMDTNGKRRLLRHGPHRSYEQLLFKGNCLSTSATVVSRTKLLETGGFSENPQFNGVEDYELWLRLAQSGCRIAYIHEPLGIYRIYGRGITSRIEEHCVHYLNVLEAHFESRQPENVYSRYLMRKRRAAALRGAGRAFIGAGQHREARVWFMKSLLQDPFSWKAWALSTLNLLRIRV